MVSSAFSFHEDSSVLLTDLGKGEYRLPEMAP